jgi:hypothetical protein
MRTTRLFAAAAVFSLAAALAPAAAHAAPAGRHTVNMWSGPGIRERINVTCPSAQDLYAPGAEYSVADKGIHIWSLPGDRVEWGIGKGTLFLSDWHVAGRAGLYQCIIPWDGKRWVLGVSDAAHVHYGWVGLGYLEFISPIIIRTIKS